jgi:two-component system, sensor histidine kinase PdtaS
VIPLRREPQLARTILNQTAGFIGLLDLDGTLLDVNQAPLDVAGFRREDVIGKPFWDTGWWNRSPAVQAALKDGIASAARGCPVHDEALYFTADGSERFADRSIVPIRDESGRVTHIVAEGRDVTERKALERALRENEQLFRLVFQMSPAALIITCLEDGLVLDANEALLTLHGLRREDVIGRTVESLGWWANRADRDEFVRLLSQRGSLRDLMFQWRTPSGEPRQFILSFERIDIHGQPCVLTTHVDVTERERVLILEERQRISADLHDNTVQSLYAAVLRLAAGERLLDRARDADSANASDALTQLRALIEEAKRSVLETIQTTRAVVDGLASGQMAQRGFRQALAAIGDDLERGTGARVRVAVAADAEKLLDSELATGLLLLAREAASNVARHAHATSVTFAVAAGEREIHLIVRDNGRGVDAPNVIGAAPPHHGLRIMAQRAEQLGGRLQLESAPDQGTVVRIRVPRPLAS